MTRPTHASRRAVMAVVLALAGCAGKPPAPDWQVESHGSLERYRQAALTGATRAADAEFARARAALASTGDSALVARAELVRCAVEAASLGPVGCPGFEALRADAAPAELAYSEYLAGRPLAADRAALLPPAHCAVAAGGAQALASVDEPLARLVAASVLLRAGQATPGVLSLAVDTASAQGWRKPLLAWLGAQAMRAEQAGAQEEAQRLRRRMALVEGR